MNPRLEQEARKSVNPEAAKELLDIFHSLSSNYGAGWQWDIELSLWESTLQIDDNLPTFAWKTLKKYELNEIIRLSQLCQGWWAWKETEGESFVSLDEIQGLYDKWKCKKSKPVATPKKGPEPPHENPNGIMYNLRNLHQ